MVYLYLKIALAVILSAMPFIFVGLVKPKAKKSRWKNIFTLTKINSQWVANVTEKIRKFIVRIYEAMKHSDNARKFFIMILIITMILFQWIDSEAAHTAVRKIVLPNGQIIKSTSVVTGLFPFLTSPIITVLAMLYTLFMFKYKWANALLVKIKKSIKLTIFLCILIIISMIVGKGRFFLAGELIFLTIAWAMMMPLKTGKSGPNGGIKIKKEKSRRIDDFTTEKKVA